MQVSTALQGGPEKMASCIEPLQWEFSGSPVRVPAIDVVHPGCACSVTLTAVVSNILKHYCRTQIVEFMQNVFFNVIFFFGTLLFRQQ